MGAFLLGSALDSSEPLAFGEGLACMAAVGSDALVAPQNVCSLGERHTQPAATCRTLAMDGRPMFSPSVFLLRKNPPPSSEGDRISANGGDKPPPYFFLTSLFEGVQHTFFQIDIDTIRAISLYIQMHFI